jgi:hypothetical protein
LECPNSHGEGDLVVLGMSQFTRRGSSYMPETSSRTCKQELECRAFICMEVGDATTYMECLCTGYLNLSPCLDGPSSSAAASSMDAPHALVK